MVDRGDFVPICKLSFNNDGPFGTFFRYSCDNGAYLARYDALYGGDTSNKVDLSGVGY